MTARPARFRPLLALVGALPLVGLLAATPSHAQFKVVGPDGKVTYTDRAPSANNGQVQALSGRSTPAAPEAALPLELRQAVTRYPVTLYASTGTCEPCGSARALLRQRGVPYVEKQVQTVEDAIALEKISGGRDAPTLAIGSQIMRGLSVDLWNSYLDAAGYPRESKLPAAYRFREPTPIVDRREAGATGQPAPGAPGAPAAPPAEPAPEASVFDRTPPASGGIRF